MEQAHRESARKTLSLNRKSAPPSTPKTTSKDKVISINKKKLGVSSVKKTPKQRGSHSTTKTPPPQLLKTWVWMWQSGPSITVQEEGKRKLLQVFGSVAALERYVNNG